MIWMGYRGRNCFGEVAESRHLMLDRTFSRRRLENVKNNEVFIRIGD